jgi:hypothetical protein
MPTLYVARSNSLQGWASDVGLTQHVYKLGLSEDDGDAAIAALNAARDAGRDDWLLLAERQTDDADGTVAIQRAARKETLVDPTYYPQIRRATGIFKVKLANVENHFMVREALEGQQIKKIKVTPALIADYLLRIAAG